MTKKFRKGLVVGKFSPQHFGHEALIELAVLQCEQVLILSYTNPEFAKCDRETRERWLKSRFPQQEVVVLDATTYQDLIKKSGYTYAWDNIPHNDDPQDVHIHFCAQVLLCLLGTSVDAVFSSEASGEPFAQYLTDYFNTYLGTTFTVEHVMYDQERKHAPIRSATIRENPAASRSYISSNVYSSLLPRLAILGGESSGKTTLAKALAAQLNTGWVSEYNRDMREKHCGDLRYEDFLHIAETQVKSERVLARRSANGVLICDTTPLMTLFYCQKMFRENSHQRLRQLAGRLYDYTVVCAPTITFEQGSFRQTESLQQEMHTWILQQLDIQGIQYLVVDGTVEERVAQVSRLLYQ
jgi:HTH-type transcriptional repressor of NAD biosynthesis genes